VVAKKTKREIVEEEKAGGERKGAQRQTGRKEETDLRCRAVGECFLKWGKTQQRKEP